MPQNERTPHYYAAKNGSGVTPIDLIHARQLDFDEGCIIKYVSRWREKDGLKDLRKAAHNLEFLIQEAEAAETQRVADELSAKMREETQRIVAEQDARMDPLKGLSVLPEGGLTLPEVTKLFHRPRFGDGITEKGKPLPKGVDVVTDQPPKAGPPNFLASPSQFLSVDYRGYRYSPGYLADHGFEYREAMGVEGTDSYMARGWYLKRGEQAA